MVSGSAHRCEMIYVAVFAIIHRDNVHLKKLPSLLTNLQISGAEGASPTAKKVYSLVDGLYGYETGGRTCHLARNIICIP